MKKNKSKAKDSKNFLDDEPKSENEYIPIAIEEPEIISNDSEKELNFLNKPQEREDKLFEVIKGIKGFTDLMKKENKIVKDFHGIRDLCNLIRGIAIELKSGNFTDNEKVLIIIEYIERNFGGKYRFKISIRRYKKKY